MFWIRKSWISLLAIGSSAPVLVKSRCYCSHQIQRKPALKTYLAERHLTNQKIWKGCSQEIFHANSTKLTTNKTKRAVGAWNVGMEKTAHKRTLQHFHQCSSWEGQTKCKGSPSSREHAASLTFRLMCFLSSGLRRERSERPLLLARFSLFKKVQSKAKLFLLLYPRYPCSFNLWLRTAWYRVKSERLIQRKEGTAQWLGRAECKSPWEPAWAFLKKIAPNIPVKRLISSGGCSFYQVGDNHSAYDWCFKW